MAYTIGQYNKGLDQDDGIFMDFIFDGPAVGEYTKKVGQDIETSGMQFKDECLDYNFSNEQSYYFQGKIKKRNMDQTFYVKLIKKNASTSDAVEQFVAELNIPGGYSKGKDGWWDVEFTFTPYIAFDGLWFQLIRTKEDYTTAPRYPKIIYQELSTMNNLLIKKNNLFEKMDTGIIKMGIQSRPHLPMFINKEEIRTDRSGIYEVKNGNVLVNSFTIISRGELTDPSKLTEAMATIDDLLPDGDDSPEDKSNKEWKNVKSISLIGEPKTRKVDLFTMDYMFRDKPSQ